MERTREALDTMRAGDEDYTRLAVEAAARRAQARAEEIDRSLRAATDLRSGVRRGLADLARETEDYASQAEQAVAGAFRGMEDALVKFASEGKLSFRSLADSIIADLARIAVRRSITGPLFSWLQTALAAPAAPAGHGDLPGTSYGTAHSGGIVGALATRRSGVPAGAFAGAPRLHGGGIAGLRSDEVPTILRRGEGVFTPEQMAALGSAPDVHVEIHVENRGTPQRLRETGRRIDGRRLVIAAVAEDVAEGGDVSRAVQSRFGLGLSPS